MLETMAWLPERSEKAAVFIHHIGMVAQDRGDYNQALEWYRKSLDIEEELGNREGKAGSICQMGALLTETGHAAEAIPANLQGLAISLQLRVPQSSIDLHNLTRQREMVGEERFLEILGEHLDEANREAVLGLLEQYEQARKEQGEG